MTASAFAQVLEAKLGQRVATIVEARGETTIEVLPENWLEVARTLRDDAALRFEQAVDVCGVDYLSYGDAEWDTTATLARRSVVAASQGADLLEGLVVDAARMAARAAEVEETLRAEQRSMSGGPTEGAYLGANDLLIDTILERAARVWTNL